MSKIEPAEPMYIRLDARLRLIIDEIAEMHNTNASVVVRALCWHTLENILDDEGNISTFKTNCQDTHRNE